MSASDRRTFIKTVLLATGAVFTDWGVKAFAGEQQPVPSKNIHYRPQVGSLNYKQAHAIFRDKSQTFTTPAPKEKVDVVVIGGGVSGLTAAWAVHKAGKSVLVLENESSVGGMARQSTIGNFIGDLGTSRFSRNDDIYKELYDDCKLAAVQLPTDGYWLDVSHIMHDIYNEQTLRNAPIMFDGMEAFRKFRDYILEMDDRPLFPLVKANPDSIVQYDKNDATDFVTAFGSFNLVDWLDVYGTATFGQSLRQVNTYSLLATYFPYLGPAYDAYTYSFAEGMHSLPDRIKKAIGNKHVREATLAVEAKNVEKGVEVTAIGAEGPFSVRAGAAIVATQKLVASHIVSDLPGLQKEKMRGMPYAPVVTVQLRCNAPLFTSRSFIVWMRDNDRRFTNIQDMSYVQDMQSGTLDRKTGDFYYSLQCSPPPSDMQKLENEQWLVQFAQNTVGALSEYFGNIFEIAKEVSIFAWGHALPTPKAGTFEVLYPAVQQPNGKIFFANNDNDICSLLESSIFYGHYAADAALKALRS